MSQAIPLLGVSLGTVSTMVGAGGISMLLFSGTQLPKRDRVSIGVAALTLVGIGTALATVSQMQLRGGRA